MKFTFLLPAYKPNYLRESLGSIISQTYSNFSILVSDDASPYDIKAIVDSFEDDRIKYRRNETNIGAINLVNHWNLLLSLVDSEYIIMASDDDIYEPTFLEEINKITEMHPRANIIRPLIRQINGQGEQFFIEPPIKSAMISKYDYLQLFSTSQLCSGISQYIFKRHAIIDNNGFANLPMAWYADDITILNLSKETGIAICNKVLFSMRYSADSISSGFQSNEYIYYKILSTCKYIEIIRNELNCWKYKDIKRKLVKRSKLLMFDLLLPGSLYQLFKYSWIIFKQHCPEFHFILYPELVLRWTHYHITRWQPNG